MQDNEAFSGTEVSLTLGGKAYTLKFGLHTMRRIQEQAPGFSIMDPKMPFFFVVPFLIQQAIDPAQHGWKSEDDFIALYEEYIKEPEAEKVLNLIPLAFQNAMGFTDRLYEPVVNRLSQMADELEAEVEAKRAKKEGLANKATEEQQKADAEKAE